MTDADPAAPASGRQYHRRILGALFVIVALAAAGFYWRNYRVHAAPIVEGIYRTSQPSPRQLAAMISAFHLRTIINLRGGNERRSWYREEEAQAQRSGVGLVSLPFETFDWPPQIETRALIHALDSSPNPILIHCESGVDRSGWAAATVLLLHGHPYEEALQQMSVLRGHFCLRSSCPLHRFFDMYQAWIARTNQIHSAYNFRLWVMTVYCPEPYNASFRWAMQGPPVVAPDEEMVLQLSVTNASHSTWASSSDPRRGIRLGVRSIGPFKRTPADPLPMFRKAHTTARDLFRESAAVTTTSPGESRVVLVRLKAPHEPGRYVLQFDMVDEMVHWFSDLGGPGVLVPLEVRRPEQG